MKKIVSILIALLALATSAASAHADDGSVRVSAAQDQTKALSQGELLRLNRVLERSGSQLRDGRTYYVTPAVTSLETVIRGSRSVVSCSLKVVVTQSSESTLAGRAAIIRTNAKVMTSARRARAARGECIASAAASIDRDRLRAR